MARVALALVLIAITAARSQEMVIADVIPDYELMNFPPPAEANFRSNKQTLVTTKPVQLASKAPTESVQKPSGTAISTAVVQSTVTKATKPPQIVIKVSTPKPQQTVSNQKPVSASNTKPVAGSNQKPVAASNQKPAAASNQKPVAAVKPTQKPPQRQQTTSKPPAQLSPCVCQHGQCTCCSGPILDFFQQKACMNVVYTPEDFSFDLTMLLNNRVMYKNKISGKNPPPACIRIPRLTSLKLCAKFSNIYFTGRNIHMCMGMEGLWDYYELFSFNFDCVRMGANGIAVVKPEEGGVIPGIPGGVDAIIDSGDDIEDYDENVVRSVD